MSESPVSASSPRFGARVRRRTAPDAEAGDSGESAANFARDILDARQAVAVAAPEEKWAAVRSAVALDPEWEETGERPVFRDRAALVALLSAIGGPVRRPRGEEPSEWDRHLVALGVVREASREPEPPSEAPEREPDSLAGVRVLVVEDQWDSRDLMAEILRSAGCDVEAAGSVTEAIESLTSVPPDVLVSDIGMPGEDGYSLLRKIRRSSDVQIRSIPALAVSAYAREEDRIRSLAAGFQMHLAKPFEPVDLLVAVGRLARRGAPAPALPRASGDGGPQILLIEDNADVRDGLRELLESSGYRVDVAEDGLEGVERALTLRPRIALIDIGLPRLDGYGVAERIRNLLPKDEVALIALTGRTHPEDLHRVVASGFDDYLSKPISFERLDALLASRLAASRRPTGA